MTVLRELPLPLPLPLSLPLPIARHLHVMVPVLSLAADALIDLDGAEAITGLWTSTSILSLPRFYFLILHPNQSLQNVRNLSRTALASNTSLGDSGIASSRLAELTNLSLSPRILHI